MNDLFPFYVLLNKELVIINFGKSIEKIYGLQKGESFNKYFEVDRPISVKTFDDMLGYKDSPFIINCLGHGDQKIRGQMYSEADTDLICFLGTPLVSGMSDLARLNLNFTDLPIHDSIGQFLLSLQMHQTALKETRQMAEKMKVSYARLEEINESLDGFIYKLTHDLRGSAINLFNMLEMLQQNLDVEENSNNDTVLGYAHKSSKRLLQTIKDFIELSKAEHSGTRVRELCSISTTLASAKEDLQIEIKESDCEIIENLQEADAVLVAPDDFKSIIQNLLSNSIKYRSEDRKLKIVVESYMRSDDTIHISFSDNGIGIDLKTQKRKLFQMFSRLHSIPNISGTGVGLYLIKKLIEKNRGSILIESEVDKGTSFSIVLDTELNKMI